MGADGRAKRAWLGDVSAVVLQQALADLNKAHRNFFDSLSGKRKGAECGTAFTAVLEYKAALHGREFRRIGNTCGGEVRPAVMLAPAGEAGSRRGAP